ncbi:MAG: hypothetical protein NVSMB14_07870 [Isosphaeraceae bacterium]
MKPSAIMMLFAASTILFALIGGQIGFVLGRYYPDYYYTVFPGLRQEPVNTVALGVGLGVTQGAALGFGVALLASVLGALSNRRDRQEKLIEGLRNEIDLVRSELKSVSEWVPGRSKDGRSQG